MKRRWAVEMMVLGMAGAPVEHDLQQREDEPEMDWCVWLLVGSRSGHLSKADPELTQS